MSLLSAEAAGSPVLASKHLIEVAAVLVLLLLFGMLGFVFFSERRWVGKVTICGIVCLSVFSFLGELRKFLSMLCKSCLRRNTKALDVPWDREIDGSASGFTRCQTARTESTNPNPLS